MLSSSSNQFALKAPMSCALLSCGQKAAVLDVLTSTISTSQFGRYRLLARMLLRIVRGDVWPICSRIRTRPRLVVNSVAARIVTWHWHYSYLSLSAFASSEVFAAMQLRIPFFWHMTHRHEKVRSRHFEGTYCLHLQGSVECTDSWRAIFHNIEDWIISQIYMQVYFSFSFPLHISHRSIVAHAYAYKNEIRHCSYLKKTNKMHTF